AILPGHGGSIASLAFSPDGATLAVPSNYSPLQFWHVATSRKRDLRLPTKVMYSLAAYAPDGRRLLASRFDGGHDLVLYDSATGGERLRLTKPTAWAFNDAAFLPTGKALVAAVYTGPILVYDTDSGKKQQQLALPFHMWAHLAVAPDGRHVAVAVNEGLVF